MKEYNLSPVHEAVGEAYTTAQNLRDDEFRKEMTAGVINVARQARAAEELDNEGLFEAADALEYGAEGMADVFIQEQAKKEQAQGYREAMTEMFGSEQPNPMEIAEAVAGRAEVSARMAEKGMNPPVGSEQLGEEIGQLEELQEQLEYGAEAQRDAIGAERVAEETATAYGGSIGPILNEYDALQTRVASDLQEGDEDMRVATVALQAINPGEEEVDLGVEYEPEL